MSEIRGFPETLGRFVADLQTRLSLPASDDPLTLPRARLITPGEAAPEVFRPSYEALLSGAPGLSPYTVLLPAFRRNTDKSNGWLVCCLGTNIHVLEDAGGQVRSVCYPVGQVSFVETGKVLLYSWVRLHGRIADGAFTSTELRFNTVTDYVIEPIVTWARSPIPAQEGSDLDAERDKFDYLRWTNLKLRNYARRSIMPGERVVQHIYQPEIRVEVFRLAGFPLLRKRSDAHMTILTGRELILIQDGDFRRLGRSGVYGGIWHYLPLDKIVSMSVAEAAENLLTLTITLPGNERVACLFSPSLRSDLDMLVSRFEVGHKLKS